jgi:hypothetical protein
MATALGYCAAFGTLMPPIFSGEFVGKVLGTTRRLSSRRRSTRRAKK